MKNRITPDNITSLKENEIFTFGSNEGGRHSLGAAKTAMKWGAKYGQGEGLMGNTYGLPTKPHDVRITLPIDKIGIYVKRYIEFCRDNPQQIFLTTEIGCGLAGLKPKDIAPLFKDAIDVENIYLPARFWHKLGY